ncbi:MAG: NAD-dependent epimerase/dehydratase family protein [Campylobacterota bacterium]|nr:NAD-dependent epimerase/dehydratase family protein [Campylobacterota bacterium]
MPKYEKILVTGATGFIGNHLIKYLLKSESFEVIATSTDIEKTKKCDWFDKVKYIQYDIDTQDNEDLYTFFGKPDRVVYLAWGNLSNYNDLIHIEKFLPNSYLFIKNLVQNGLKDIVVSGTCFEYGLVEGCLSEDISTNPSNSYAIAKDSLYKFIGELNKNFDFSYKWIRLFYMYGDGQSENSLLPLLDKAIKNGDKEFNMSGGEQLRDYLDIDEVVKNIILISTQTKYINQAINCCSAKPCSVRSLVEKYLENKKYTMKLNMGYYPYSIYEPMAFWGDDSKLKKIKEMV